ncbi:MAG TPA: PLDc N-terminal domain-containing protein [Candidatus Yaniella excrementigallinarum]|nr:PLDc N-terminal domain-containing protein [Candidatus Yaniella excrementigallinarum]
MPRLLIPLIIVSLGVMIYALIEAFSTPSDRTRIMPKGIWIVVIILIPLIGGVLWLLFGNENAYLASTVQGFKKTTGPSRPSNPDDDEEFLRSLDIQRAQKRRAEELDKRERELRRREEELDEDDGNQNPA